MTSPLRSASSTKARAASFLQRVGGLEEAGGDLLGQDVGLGQDEGVLNVAHDGVEAGQGLDDGAFATRDLDGRVTSMMVAGMLMRRTGSGRRSSWVNTTTRRCCA
jgi:hypothetical protein